MGNNCRAYTSSRSSFYQYSYSIYNLFNMDNLYKNRLRQMRGERTMKKINKIKRIIESNVYYSERYEQVEFEWDEIEKELRDANVLEDEA